MRVHIFVDAENFNPRIFIKAYAVLKIKYSVVRVDIFSKEATLPAKYDRYQEDDRVHFVKCFWGKNSADTFMSVSIMKALYEEALTDIFVIVSEDRDFAPVIKAITDFKKRVIIVTQKDRTMHNIEQIGANMQYVTNMEIGLKDTSLKEKQVIRFTIPEDRQKFINGRDISSCFVKTKRGRLLEVPFYSGIDTTSFSLLAPLKTIREGWGKNAKLSSVLKDSYLKIVDGRIYYDVDRMMEE